MTLVPPGRKPPRLLAEGVRVPPLTLPPASTPAALASSPSLTPWQQPGRAVKQSNPPILTLPYPCRVVHPRAPCFAPGHCSMFVHRVVRAKYEPGKDDLKPITHVTPPSCYYVVEMVCVGVGGGGWVCVCGGGGGGGGAREKGGVPSDAGRERGNKEQLLGGVVSRRCCLAGDLPAVVCLSAAPPLPPLPAGLDPRPDAL